MAAKQKTVTAEYVMGIREGREAFRRHGMEFAREEVEALTRTIKNFGASHPVGQMLRGERDFWRHQIALAAQREG